MEWSSPSFQNQTTWILIPAVHRASCVNLDTLFNLPSINRDADIYATVLIICHWVTTLLCTQQLKTTHIYCLAVSVSPEFGPSPAGPLEDWRQRDWWSWGLIWESTGEGSTSKLTQGVSKMYVLVVVGLKPSFTHWLVTEGHLQFLATWAPMRPLAFSKPAREKEVPTCQALLCNAILQSHLYNHITFITSYWLEANHRSFPKRKGVWGGDDTKVWAPGIGGHGAPFRVCPLQCLRVIVRSKQVTIHQALRRESSLRKLVTIDGGRGDVITTIGRMCP